VDSQNGHGDHPHCRRGKGCAKNTEYSRSGYVVLRSDRRWTLRIPCRRWVPWSMCVFHPFLRSARSRWAAITGWWWFSGGANPGGPDHVQARSGGRAL